MSEEKKPFKVSDRRHFTREGDVRTDVPPSESPPRPAAPAPRPEPPPAPPATPRAAAPPLPGEDAPGAQLDFVGLLLSLGTQASMMLGQPPHGEAGGASDPAGARAIIALLEVLQDKTEGRRTPEEDEVLEGLLYELRMAYVAATRKGGR